MQNKELDTQKMLRMVQTVAPKHCDLCGQKYAEGDFNLIRDQWPQVVVHLKCSNCGNNYVLNVFNPTQGLIGSTRSQLNLDIQEASEIVAFAGSKPISSNEALDAYNLLTKSPILISLLERP